MRVCLCGGVCGVGVGEGVCVCGGEGEERVEEGRRGRGRRGERRRVSGGSEHDEESLQQRANPVIPATIKTAVTQLTTAGIAPSDPVAAQHSTQHPESHDQHAIPRQSCIHSTAPKKDGSRASLDGPTSTSNWPRRTQSKRPDHQLHEQG